MKNPYTHTNFPAGTIVSVPYARVLRHYGVVTTRGTVISNSRKGGGVIEQSFAAFGNALTTSTMHSRPDRIAGRSIMTSSAMAPAGWTQLL